MSTPPNFASFEFEDEQGHSYRLMCMAVVKDQSGLILPDDLRPAPAGDPGVWLNRVLICLRTLDGVSTSALMEDPVLSNLSQAFTDLGITLGQLYTVVKMNLGEARAKSLVHGLANHVLENTAIWGTTQDGTTVVVHQGEAAAAPDKDTAS